MLSKFINQIARIGSIACTPFPSSPPDGLVANSAVPRNAARACLLLIFTTAAASAEPYRGPGQPTIPSDTAVIHTTLPDCLKDVKAVGTWTQDQAKMSARQLCDARTKHAVARTRLTDRLARLVTGFKDDNNNGKADLATTIGNVQTLVKLCVATLESRQTCHHVACLTIPEENATFCEKQAGDLLEQIIR